MTERLLLGRLVVAALAVVPGAVSSAAPVALAANGRALAAIHTDAGASVETQSVAVELAEYLRRITGAQFAVNPAEPGPGRIVLGRVDEFPELGVADLRGKGREAFLIRARGTDLLLLGNSDRAVSHAAFAFLEDLGCRWYFPTPEWEIVPHRETLTVELDRIDEPDMMVRGIWYGAMNGYFTANYLLQDWKRHNRLPRERIVTSHTWAGLDPKKDFAAHPDWFALVKGKRQPTKPCYSHPEVIRKAVAYVLAKAGTGVSSVSVSAPDGLGFCECERCFAVFQGGDRYVEKEALMGRRPDGTVVCATSETIFAVANAAARALAEKHPDALVGVLAYSGYSHPPSFDFEPNVYVQVTSGYRRTPLSFEEQIEAFGRKAQQIGVYEYYFISQWHRFKPGAGIKIAKLKQIMPWYRANSVRGIWAEATNNWAPAGLGFYVACRMMWDTDADADALYSDFLERAFEGAAVPMRRYYDRWEAGTELSAESVAAAVADLAEAYSRTTDAATRTRISLLYLYMRFLRAGERYRELKDSGSAEAGSAGAEYTELFWRLKNSHMLHDLVARNVNRPFLPGYTPVEIAAMLAAERE